MTRSKWLFGMSLVLLLAGLATSADREVSLGHKNFYPSPEHPVGFRGDGNGYFPGATPVSEWREGTVGVEKKGNRGETPILIDKMAHNIVWKTEMPSWANTQPTVVGDRIFTTAEPNWLVCVDAHSGKVLWSVSANPWELIGIDPDRAGQTQTMYDIWREVVPHFDKMRGSGTMSRRVPSREFIPIADAFVRKILPRIVPVLNELDPLGSYDAAAKVTAEAVTRYSAALAESEKPDFKGQAPGWKHDPINGQMTRLSDALSKRIQIVAGSNGTGRSRLEKIPLEVPWGHLVGFGGPAPVSDGERVFASFGQGQTVCYDLNGTRIWGVHHLQETDESRTTVLQSPLLIGNVLVDMHGGRNVLRGLDKSNGKVLWEAPTKGKGLRPGGGYYVGSHKVMRLDHQGKPVDVIVTSLCNIIRASDGKVLGTLPFEFAPSGGPSIVGSGDVVLKGAVGDNYVAPYVAYRLRFVDEDTVEAKEIWQTERKSTPGYQSVAMTPTALLMPSTVHTVMDPRTGRVYLRGGISRIGGFSNVVAGNLFLWVEDGSSGWNTRGDEVFGCFGTADITDLEKIEVIGSRNLLGGVNKPRVPPMEKYAPELYAMKFYTGNAFGWPAHFLHADTTVFPSGNRLFIRALSHLYCIGDPSVPFDWNPASRSAKITQTLKNAEPSSSPGEGKQ